MGGYKYNGFCDSKTDAAFGMDLSSFREASRATEGGLAALRTVGHVWHSMRTGSKRLTRAAKGNSLHGGMPGLSNNCCPVGTVRSMWKWMVCFRAASAFLVRNLCMATSITVLAADADLPSRSRPLGGTPYLSLI